MKEITYFYLRGCPHCKRADKFIDQLIEENPQYANIVINRIEETQNRRLADSFDYYYVPCLYADGEKLHEGTVTKEDIKAVLDAAL